MTPVLQTIIDKNNGNCLQAVVASLFDVPLDNVPHFISLPGDDWWYAVLDYYKSHNYDGAYFGIRHNDMTLTTDVPIDKILKYDGGVNGYFWGTVKSQTFNDGTTHAVVIDIEGNIVHDPNPNQLAMKLTKHDILGFFITKRFYVNNDGEFIDY